MSKKQSKFTHCYNHKVCVDRLIGDYNTHDDLIIAFDFDNTIFDYHNIGGDFSQVIDLLAKASEMGFTMILFTSNNDPKRLEWMKEYCNHFKIKVDYVNESPVMQGKGKPYYNILLDDRAGLEEAYYQLDEVLTRIENLDTDLDLV